jgi:hypothetical protein
MRIISFAWTIKEVLTGQKTVTRRFWIDEYAKAFKKGDLVSAWDKLPYAGGKKIAILRLTCNPYKEPLYQMTDAEERAEGGKWGSASAFVREMEKPGQIPWVIRFELVEVI